MNNFETTKPRTIKRRGIGAGRTAASFIGIDKHRPVPTDPVAATGVRIRRLREQLKMSRPAFAKHFGINAISVKNYELSYRAVDFDAVRNICEGFGVGARDSVIEFIALGKNSDPRSVPNVSLGDLAAKPVQEREISYNDGMTEGDLAVAKLVREIRTEFFGLSRPKFVLVLGDSVPVTTVKNYERSARRVSYAYARLLASHARSPLEAWKTFMAASRQGPIDLAAWYSTKV